MSLTTLLDRPEVRARFKEEFPKPTGPVQVGLAAPPLTESYSLTGTAFDYLLRWYVKKINPQAYDRKWVAESALSVLTDMGKKAAAKKAKQVVLRARHAYLGYLSRRGQEKPEAELIGHAIRLAYLDSVFRAKILDASAFGLINAKVLEDLSRLIDLVTREDFLAHKICILNPTFGRASKLVGGADGDLLLDDALMELKTTKALELERQTFNQLIGYYLLSRIGRVTGCPREHQISHLAVYFSRYGVTWKVSIRDVIDENRLPNIVGWFRQVARSANEG